MITWFTDPQNPYSSYCQYDPVTKQFVRIRLELGRDSEGVQLQALEAEYRPLTGASTVEQYEREAAMNTEEEFV